MAIGPGKYDDLCTEARNKSGGAGAILIIIDGHKGFGFSVQASPLDVIRLPQILRTVAAMIDGDMREKGKI